MTNPNRRPPRCPNHRDKHVAGCTPCRTYQAWYSRTRKAEIAAGTWRPPLPVDQVRPHVLALVAANLTHERIAARAGVGRDAVARIARGASKTVLGHVAEAILGVPVPADPPRKLRRQTNLVDATGSRRRLQALAVCGWSTRDLARETGLSVATIQDVQRPKGWETVEPATAARIRAVYDRIDEATPGPTKVAATRARAKKWAPPLAWDDDTIDDPAARPTRHGDRTSKRSDVDEVAVALALTGDRPATITQAEQREAIHRAWLAQVSDDAIAARLGIQPDSVQRVRQRHGWTRPLERAA